MPNSWIAISDVKLLLNNKMYFKIFYFFFFIIFIAGILYLPKEMNEQVWLDVDIRLLEYKIQNNISLEETNAVWNSITASNNPADHLTWSIYGAPLYSFLRSFLLKIPIHPMITYNLFNLLVSMLLFYGSFLLIKLLFDNSIAIKSLLIMLTFQGFYTVTRFSGRGYLVIGLVLIIFGIYFLWKSCLAKYKYGEMLSGLFFGLSWLSGNHMLKITPMLLFVSLIFYLIYQFKNKSKVSSIIKKLAIFFVSFLVISLTVSIIISQYFGLGSDWLSFLLNSKFRAEQPVGMYHFAGWAETFRRLRLFIFFPSERNVINHVDEYIYSQSLIPEIFIVFIFIFLYSIFEKRKITDNLPVFFAGIVSMIPIFLIPFLSQWEIRYNIVFLPFIAILVVLGMDELENIFGKRIKLFKTLFLGIVILLLGAKSYSVNIGEYAGSWNNASSCAGHRQVADFLNNDEQKDVESLMLLTDFMDPIHILAYGKINRNHKFRYLGHMLDFKTGGSLKDNFLAYEKSKGRVYIVLQDEAGGWQSLRLLKYYPSIKLKLQKRIELPKQRSFYGKSMNIYSVEGF